MLPPVWSILKASVPVTAVFGSAPMRIFAFGRVPQGTVLPYAVFQTVAGIPENYLAQVPNMDGMTLQFDVYAAPTPAGSQAALDGAEAIRNAVEPVAYVTAWRGESRDPDTNNYRYSFDVDFLTPR